MTNGVDKRALFNLTSEPYLKPISDLGVGFYNLDENTAILTFQLSNNEGPLLISNENLTAYAYFESTNGSTSDVIELKIEDEFNGIVSVTLDSAFLHACTDTTVKAQVYIGVNNVDGDTQYNEVAVLNEFQFEVADALINKISSTTKIEYIRMFSELKQRIEQEVKDIKEAIASGADYVTEMRDVLQQGKDALNKIVIDGETNFNSLVTQSKTEITGTISQGVEEITNLVNNSKTALQNTADTSIDSITAKTTDASSYVDTKITEFNNTIDSNGFVTPEQLTASNDALNWQKYKLTEADGTLLLVSIGSDVEYMRGLAPGIYYATSVPITGATSTAGFLTVDQRSTLVKRITFRPYNSVQVFIQRYYNAWSDWERVNIDQTDTGWVPFQLINGASSNTAYKATGDNGFDCSYRTTVNGAITTRRVRLNGTNITHGQTIANLPSNFCKNAQTFPIRIPTKYSGGYVVIRPSGEVKFYINGDASAWVITDYVYGEIAWID